jgi:hypothetical protein
VCSSAQTVARLLGHASNRGDCVLQMLKCLIAALGGVYLSQLTRPSDASALIAKLRPSAIVWTSESNEARKGGLGA